jgi:hypothetical protein
VRVGHQRKTNGVFIVREVSHRYSNGRPFGPCTPTQVCSFENRASCTSYLDGQANYQSFQRKVHKRWDGRATVDTYYEFINVNRTLHQPSIASGRRRSKD